MWLLLIMLSITSIVTLVLGVVMLLNALAEKNYFFTRVESGGFKFLVKGETLETVLDVLPEGKYVDTETYMVSETTGKPRKRTWLEKNWGVVLVSLLWPLKKIHIFDVVADKLREVSGDHPIRERIQTEIRRDVDYLRYRFPHPVLIKDVELGKDRWKIDIILMLDIRVVNPVTVVFSYKGKVMEQIDAAVSSVVIDYCGQKEFGYPEIINTPKGTDSRLAAKIISLNNDTTANPDPDGLKDRFGIEILAVMIEAIDLSPEQKILDEAAKLVEQRRHEANAREEEARGLAAIERATREGIGQGLAAIADQLKVAGLRREEAAKILFEQVRTGNLAGSNSKLTTYVEGGGNVQPTLPIKKEED